MKSLILALTLALTTSSAQASLAANTPIKVSDGEYKNIALFSIGDPVTTGDTTVTPGSVPFKSSTVKFSSGTPSANTIMVYISYGDDESLIATSGQPLVLASGKMVRADTLVPGNDLMGETGIPVSVNLVSVGYYSGGIHAISTSTNSSDLGKAVLVANGIVVGSYLDEIFLSVSPTPTPVLGF